MSDAHCPSILPSCDPKTYTCVGKLLYFLLYLSCYFLVKLYDSYSKKRILGLRLSGGLISGPGVVFLNMGLNLRFFSIQILTAIDWDSKLSNYKLSITVKIEASPITVLAKCRIRVPSLSTGLASHSAVNRYQCHPGDGEGGWSWFLSKLQRWALQHQFCYVMQGETTFVIKWLASLPPKNLVNI